MTWKWHVNDFCIDWVWIDKSVREGSIKQKKKLVSIHIAAYLKPYGNYGNMNLMDRYSTKLIDRCVFENNVK